jgi:hypothetical protein
MTANPIERLDVQAAVVEQRHQLDASDTAFAALACMHPEACACDDDPGWAAFIARQVALNSLWREAARFNAANPVGAAVVAYPGVRPEDDPNDERIVTTTRSRATVLGGHTAVVWVHGHGACIALTHIDVRPGGAA